MIMKPTEKMQILNDYNEMLKKSWTYERMTESERIKWDRLVSWIAFCGTIKHLNTKNAIQSVLCATYKAYITGIGYEGANWRE